MLERLIGFNNLLDCFIQICNKNVLNSKDSYKSPIQLQTLIQSFKKRRLVWYINQTFFFCKFLKSKKIYNFYTFHHLSNLLPIYIVALSVYKCSQEVLEPVLYLCLWCQHGDPLSHRMTFHILQVFYTFNHLQQINGYKILQGSPKDGYITAIVFLEDLVFLSTWLLRWTWPKLYTTTGREWENRKYKLFDR